MLGTLIGASIVVPQSPSIDGKTNCWGVPGRTYAVPRSHTHSSHHFVGRRGKSSNRRVGMRAAEAIPHFARGWRAFALYDHVVDQRNARKGFYRCVGHVSVCSAKIDIHMKPSHVALCSHPSSSNCALIMVNYVAQACKANQIRGSRP
jgi:hypothetical protein